MATPDVAPTTRAADASPEERAAQGGSVAVSRAAAPAAPAPPLLSAPTSPLVATARPRASAAIAVGVALAEQLDATAELERGAERHTELRREVPLVEQQQRVIVDLLVAERVNDGVRRACGRPK